MDITLERDPAFMNKLHDRLITTFPVYASRFRVHGTETTVRVYTSGEGDTNPTDTPDDSAISAMVNGYLALTINATKTTIQADGTDEAALSVTGLTSFAFTVWHDGVLSNTATANDGVLELSAAQTGVYLVEVVSGNNSGYIEVIAT